MTDILDSIRRANQMALTLMDLGYEVEVKVTINVDIQLSDVLPDSLQAVLPRFGEHPTEEDLE